MRHFDSDKALQLVIVRQVYQAEPALAQHLLDPVTTDKRGRGRGRIERAALTAGFPNGLVGFVCATDLTASLLQPHEQGIGRLRVASSWDRRGRAVSEEPLESRLAFRAALDMERQCGVLACLQAVVEEPLQLLPRRAVRAHVPSPSSWRTSSSNIFCMRRRALNTAATCLPSRSAAAAAVRPSIAVNWK